MKQIDNALKDTSSKLKVSVNETGDTCGISVIYQSQNSIQSYEVEVQDVRCNNFISNNSISNNLVSNSFVLYSVLRTFASQI